jgi:hypothetical protein
MAKQTKVKKPAIQADKANTKIYRYLIAFPVLAFLIKMIVMFNLQGGGWYGADGENYTAGVDGLLNSGFFSEEPKLSYWPAGYPLLLWPLAELTVSKLFYLISIIQTLFFAYATYFFTTVLRKSSLKKFAFLTSLVISFNPTLSLSTLAVGYEAPIAACFMMIIGLTIKLHSADTNEKFWLVMAGVAGWFALAIFMQPRFLLVGALYFLYWIIKTRTIKVLALTLALSGAIMAIGPAIMIYRNSQVIDQATISTNLGVTMAIGAGDETSGGYGRTGPEVPCAPKSPATAVTDNERVRCVIEWYLANPVKTIKLSYNKSQFFWSPWSGPLADGTMARNPWLNIAPTQNIRKTQDGANLVNGNFGKAISYLWILGQLILLFWGFIAIRRIGVFERILSNLVLLPIVVSWLISIGTIGDHRFRIPTMSLSLFLQAAAFISIREKTTKAL